MSIAPQNQMLNQQVTALQHQIHNAGGQNSAIYHEITALKNNIAANKNTVTLNEHMKKINNMMIADARAPHQAAQTSNYQAGHYQQGSFQGGQYQPGHFEPGHMQSGSNISNHLQSGPSFSQHQSDQMRYGLRQMSSTLNIHPKF